MRIVDRILSGLLILGAIAHTLGVLKFYRGQPHPLFWSLCASVLILLLAAVNLLRADRPGDRGLAWVAAIASLSYAGICFVFGGYLIGNYLDPRAVGFGVVSLALAAFSLRTALSRPA